MTLFKFEILRPDGTVVAGDQRDLPSSGELWGHLEVMAIQLREQRDLRLLVKDEQGGIVAMSGVASIVESLKQCKKASCPIKDLLAGSHLEAGACAPCMTIPVLEIPELDLADTLLQARAL